jgi:hypothetical protein
MRIIGRGELLLVRGVRGVEPVDLECRTRGRAGARPYRALPGHTAGV